MSTARVELPATPVEAYVDARRRRRRWTILLLLVALGSFVAFRFFVSGADTFEDIELHFKYGSVGSEVSAHTDGDDQPAQGGHLPYHLWRALPIAFPEYLPPSATGASPEEEGVRAYERFGFLFEDSWNRPVGFSLRRHRGVDVLGLNCAVCHVGAYQRADSGRRELILAGPSNTVDLLAYFRFLFDAATDRRFTAEVLLPILEREGDFGPIDRLVYRYIVIPSAREGILQQRQYLRHLEPEFDLRHSDGQLLYSSFGPGRVDTFNSVKAIRLKMDMARERWNGTNDFPSIWNQHIRDGVFAHWDGNTDSVMERNLSAALGVGAEPDTIDLGSIERVHDWLLDLAPPRYPFPIDMEKARRGHDVYLERCASCHGYLAPAADGSSDWRAGEWQPRGVGEVVPLEDIATDPHRLNSFSQALSGRMTEIGVGKPWQFNSFRKTDGYVNAPLDGIWARAPYLHNGSVPNMWELLKPEPQRLRATGGVFHRGNVDYDAVQLGFHAFSESARRDGFLYDTSLPGLGSGGHSGPRYGTDLPQASKWDLIEYLKTL